MWGRIVLSLFVGAKSLSITMPPKRATKSPQRASPSVVGASGVDLSSVLRPSPSKNKASDTSKPKAPAPPPEEKAPDQRPRALLCVLLVLSLQSVTALVAVDVLGIADSPFAVALFGVAALSGCGYAAHKSFKLCGCTFSLSGIFFAVTTWSAAVDLVLALALLGLTDIGKFYVATGEEYFKSAWGFWALLWDGTAHFALQVYLAHATLLGRPCLRARLFWCGSIINSMPVLLLGGASGYYSKDIKPSTALNAPYVAVPITILLTSLADSLRAPIVWSASSTASPRGMKATAATIGWVAFHAAAIILHSWRAVVALGSQSALAMEWMMGSEPHSLPIFLNAAVDPALFWTAAATSRSFLQVQCLVFFFYYAPFHAWAAYELLLPLLTPARATCSPRLAAWATVVAGGYAQAQATYLGASAFSWRGFQMLEPMPLPLVSYGLAAALALFPAGFALRCWARVGP